MASTKILLNTVFVTDSSKKRFWAANRHIRMISEGSCDTEDWSNDAENSVLHHRNKLHFTIYSTILTIHTVVAFTLFFNQINAASVRLKKIVPTTNF